MLMTMSFVVDDDDDDAGAGFVGSLSVEGSF